MGRASSASFFRACGVFSAFTLAIASLERCQAQLARAAAFMFWKLFSQ